MDGVSWSTARAPESFGSSRNATVTLSRLANFIAGTDNKSQTQKQRLPHLTSYVCSECGKGFTYATELLQHQDLDHTLPKPHRCPSCGKEFSLRSSLQLHKCEKQSYSPPCEVCHGQSRLGSVCARCSSHRPDPGRPQEKSLHLQPHLLDSSPYACAPCGRGFSQKQALLQHQQAGCSEPPSPSEMVDVSSLPDDSPPVSEGDTTRSDSSDPSWPSRHAISCELCPKIFRTDAGLQRHKQANHMEECSLSPQGQKTMEECTGREKRKVRGANMNDNLSRKMKSKTAHLTCRSCDMVFSTTSKLSLHRKEKHTRKKSVRREARPVVRKRWKGNGYPCQICSKVFYHHLSLKAHYRWHSPSGLESLSVEFTAKDHKLSQSAANVVKNILPDRVNRRGRGRPKKMPTLTRVVGDLGRQKEVPDEEEEEEREFPCPSCAEVFSEQSQLKEHVELHQSVVRRRQCSVCTEDMDTCKWPGSKRHRLYHCGPCQQGFTIIDSFLEHCQEHLRVRVEEEDDSRSGACNTQPVGRP